MTPDDIRDIRGPIAIPYWWITPAIVAAVICGLALAYVVYRRLRQPRRERIKSPAEVALERIERAREMVSTRSSSEFSAELSDAVRAYLEARFALLAAHRTTEEFLHDALADDACPIAAHREALGDFLSWCDLAKFARLALTPTHANAIVDAAHRFVEATATPSTAASPSLEAVARPRATTAEVGA